MNFRLYAIVQEPGSNKRARHLEETYPDRDKAEKAARSATEVWFGGPDGPKTICYRQAVIVSWVIEEIP